MKGIILAILAVLVGLVLAVTVAADEAVIDLEGDGVVAGNRQVAITVSLPPRLVGSRINRAVLEVPLKIQQGANSTFADFPLIELVEPGSELPKQTELLVTSFDGIARFDITRLVKTWVDASDHELVLGALSEKNGTSMNLRVASEWNSGVKARLIISFSTLTGAGAASLE